MTISQSIILGIVQGLTEFLPISSSAHLNLIPWMLNWNIPESFDIALHFGTLISIVLFFYKDWLELIRSGYKHAVKKEKGHQGKMFWYIVLATIPGGAIGFFLDHAVGDKLGTMPILIAIMLIIMGIILYLADKFAPTDTEYENMTLKQTFLIGLSQALAFVPGVSRSGITMTTGRLMGVSRESTARYSFMLSTPIVLGATIYKLKDFVFDMPFIIGVATSAITGMLVIKFLLDYLKKGDLKIFAIYRIIAGIFIIMLTSSFFIINID